MSKLQDKLGLFDLPAEVRAKALQIHSTLPEEIKLLRESSQAYIIITEAYKTLKLLHDASAIRETLKISPKTAKETLKDAARRGYKPVIMQYEPSIFVPQQIYIAGIPSDHEAAVNELLETAIRLYPALSEENPEQVAAAAIIHYATVNGFSINAKTFCENCGVPTATTEKLRLLMQVADSQ